MGLNFLGMGRTAKNRSFNYIPRYYDENKERFSAILEKDQTSGDTNSMKARIASANKINKAGRRGLSTRQQSRGMFVRVLLILLALILITFWLVGLYLPSIEAFLK